MAELLKMSPSFTGNDVVNQSSGNFVLSRQSVQSRFFTAPIPGGFAHPIACSDVADLFIGEFRRRTSHPSNRVSGTRPVVTTLCHHVSHVVGVSSHPKVSGIHAIANIAGMADVHSWRNRSFCHRVRKTMNQYLLPVVRGVAVAIQPHRSLPQPTTIFTSGLVDTLPEPFLWGDSNESSTRLIGPTHD